MKEEFLHYLWANKKLASHQLNLVDGRSLQVLNYGKLNLDTGPDFFNSTVLLEELKWSGNVEMHLRSSDWYAHKHHLDATYDNVILHVVYVYDSAVFINGEEIPTLELKNIINPYAYFQYQNLLKSNLTIACKPFLPLDNLSTFQQIGIAMANRFNRKTEEFYRYYQEGGSDLKQVLHVLLFQSFGGRVNKLPFQELAMRTPYKILLKESWDGFRLVAMLLGVSGLLVSANNHPYTDELKQTWKFIKQKHNLESMSASSWRFSGVRPHSFPTMNIVQLAHFITNWRYESLPVSANHIGFLRDKFKIETHNYWQHHYSFKSKSKTKHNSTISHQLQDRVLINCFALFFWFRSRLKNKDSDMQLAIDLLQSVRPERNRLIEEWEKLGVEVENAFDSQALIEQKNIFCDNKKCLQCKIGNFILSKKS